MSPSLLTAVPWLALSAAAGQHALLMAVPPPPSAAALDLGRDLDRLATAAAAGPLGPTALERAAATADPAAALAAQARRLAPGDRLWVHISGHGTRVADDDRDEADGWDEALLLTDGGVVRDDALGAALTELRRALGPAGHLVLTLDTCHSGGLLRGLQPAARGSGPAVPGADTLGHEWVRPADALAPVTILAAARADELAEEAPGGGGRFSQALAEALVRAPAGATWSTVHARIQAALAQAAPAQHPVLLGAGHLPLAPDAPAAGGLAVDGVVAGPPLQLRIAGGTLLGLDDRARYALVLEDGRVCSAAVASTTASQTFLQPGCAAPPAALAAARVRVEREGAPPSPRRLALPPALHDRLLPLLAAEGWTAGPAALVLTTEPGPESEAGTLVLRAGATELARSPAGAPWSTSPVATALRRRRRATELAALELAGGPSPSLRLRAADPTTCAPGAVLVPDATGALQLPPGAGITVEVRHTAPGPRRIHLVHFDADNRATALLDDDEAPLLAPGEAWTSPRCWQTVPPWGTERLKLLATRAPLPLATWLDGAPLRGDWTADGATTTLTYTLSAVTAWAGAAP